MTRLWSEGQPITIQSKKGEGPETFLWQGQKHHVEEITRRWRVDMGWWRERIWRTCFKLITDTGLLVIVYQDLNDDQWYLHRMYD